MIRSLKFSLAGANINKLELLDDLWFEYRKLLQSFFMRLKRGEGLDYSYLKTIDTPLSCKYRQCICRQAMKSWKLWCRSKGKYDKKIPDFLNPQLVLSNGLVVISPGANSFDLWIKVSTLSKGHPMHLPIKSYNYANKYFINWEPSKSCQFNKKDGRWYVTLYFRKNLDPVPVRETIGVDVGYRKTVTTSNNISIGKIKDLCEKSDRKKCGSRAKQRSLVEIRNHIGRVVNQLIDGTNNIVIEDLKNLKKNKKGKWRKSTNRKFRSWYYPLILKRIRNRTEVVGVQCHAVNPSYTSQDCPECGYRDSKNRRKEEFRCIRCGYSADADYVGALNILKKFLRGTQELIVPGVIS